MLRTTWICIARIACALSIATLLVSGCGGGSNATSSTTRATSADRPASSATSLEQQFVAVVRQAQPSVAQIQTDQGLGSGVIFDTKGDVVTNAHVLAGASRIRVTLADGRQFPARLVGSFVLAAGNPLGLQSSITDGIVSAIGRNVSAGVAAGT